MGCGAVQQAKISSQNSKKHLPLPQSIKNSNKNSIKNINKQENIANIQLARPNLTESYIIKQLLGRGTSGCVYRCIDRSSQEQFALKQIKLTAKSLAQAQRQIKNLKSQISVLKKLDHPNIIKYYNFQVSQDLQMVQIVFQLVQQGTLKQYVQKNDKLTEDQVAIIAKQILEALSYLHDKNIIHRDLKCANILMDSNGVVKITDFGTARQIKLKTNQDIAKLCASLKGTPYYMAPQILKRSGHHKSADIWSFGCTLIQMLTGQAPWTSLTCNFQQIISYIVSGIHPPLPPQISKQCEYFLQSCFDIIPSQRLTAKQLLKHRFIEKNANKPYSLVYDKFSPQKQNRKDVQIVNLGGSIQLITKKHSILSKKHSINQVFNNYDHSRYQQNHQFQDQNQLPSTLDSKHGNEKTLTQKKKIKSAKRQDTGLKKVAKTAGHMKMTQQNLLNWSKIQQQLQQSTAQSIHSSPLTLSHQYARMMPKQKPLRSNTQIAQVQQSNQHEDTINTNLAIQQRTKYLQSQHKIKQKKQLQRKMWEDELQREKKRIRNQRSKRYIVNTQQLRINAK